MGLDMYIKKAPKTVTEPDYENTTEIGYWRKFNALHKWFVDNCQYGIDDCQYSIITKEKLDEILEILKNLNEENCSKNLPTTSGFFFGSTNYDEYYWNDVKLTITILDQIKNEIDWDNENIYYLSSW